MMIEYELLYETNERCRLATIEFARLPLILYYSPARTVQNVSYRTVLT